MFVNLQYIECLTIWNCTEAWLKLNIQFDCRYLELWNASIFMIVYIVLNVIDGLESEYPSTVFLSIGSYKCWLACILSRLCQNMALLCGIKHKKLLLSCRSEGHSKSVCLQFTMNTFRCYGSGKGIKSGSKL